MGVMKHIYAVAMMAALFGCGGAGTSGGEGGALGTGSSNGSTSGGSTTSTTGGSTTSTSGGAGACLPCSNHYDCGSIEIGFVSGPSGSCVTAGAYYQCDGAIVDGNGNTIGNWTLNGSSLTLCTSDCLHCTQN
ncbi:Hypothetical protein A7982_02149 [Minicystis rosea]|nr:Hypothetical protein A7982_02149 [Minicystis rosea]